MNLHKFEKQIKERLKEREIEPSEHAWQEISDRLERVRGSNRKGRYQYGIAAGFIALIIMSVVYIQALKEPESGQIQLVDSPANTSSESAQDNSDRQGVVETVAGTSFKIPGGDTDKEVPVSAVAIPLKKERAAHNISTATASQTRKVPLRTTEEIINIKIAEVVAAVHHLEIENDALSTAEVDSLLRQAQQEVLANNIYGEHQAVDAMSLLSQVESELDQSLRDQLFEKLKTGFIRVRTAVADRNN